MGKERLTEVVSLAWSDVARFLSSDVLGLILLTQVCAAHRPPEVPGPRLELWPQDPPASAAFSQWLSLVFLHHSSFKSDGWGFFICLRKPKGFEQKCWLSQRSARSVPSPLRNWDESLNAVSSLPYLKVFLPKRPCLSQLWLFREGQAYLCIFKFFACFKVLLGFICTQVEQFCLCSFL